MSRRKILSIWPVALAAAALSAPAAPAKPNDSTGPTPADIHGPGEARTPRRAHPAHPAPADLHGRAQAQAVNKDGRGDTTPRGADRRRHHVLAGGGTALTAMRHRTRTGSDPARPPPALGAGRVQRPQFAVAARAGRARGRASARCPDRHRQHRPTSS